jgi:hypothetical protein
MISGIGDDRPAVAIQHAGEERHIDGAQEAHLPSSGAHALRQLGLIDGAGSRARRRYDSRETAPSARLS